MFNGYGIVALSPYPYETIDSFWCLECVFTFLFICKRNYMSLLLTILIAFY